MSKPPLFVVAPNDDEPLDAAMARALQAGPAPLGELPALTNVALGDPFLAEQLAALHAFWELRPPPAHGFAARLRTRIAWWLLGPELQQASQVHATLVRLADSLVVLVDQERAARRRLEAALAGREEHRSE
jgi:hypothetical protein